MIELHKITGRLGNQMFQFAALYSLSKELETDFYFQDEGYFEKYKSDIKKLFGDGIGFLEQVSIHVRLGDYVGNTFYTSLWETDYYEKAIKLFPKENFLIFSDEPEFCKGMKWFDKKRMQIMDKASDVEDLNLMASCKSNIIANSSYSWWAAFLNPNPTKKIICPDEKNCFTDGKIRLRFPKEWTRINTKLNIK